MFQTTNQIMIIQKTSKTSEDTMTASQRGGIFFGSPTDSAAKKTIQVQLTRNTKKVNLNLTIFQQTYATRRLNRCQPQSNFNRLEIVSIDDSVVHEGWPKTNKDNRMAIFWVHNFGTYPPTHHVVSQKNIQTIPLGSW